MQITKENPKVTLYQLDSKERIKLWSIEVQEFEHNAVIIIQSGKKDGKLVTTTTTVSEGKNIGRANATTFYEQALKDAQSDVDLKIRAGYVEDITKVTSQKVLGSGIPQPMLAQKYDPTGKQKGSKTLSQIKILGKRVAVSRKKDGNRCFAKINLSGVELYTRKGDRFPSFKHIEDQLYKRYIELGLFNEIIIDGELYTSEVSFNRLNGLLKKEKITEKDKQDLLTVSFNIYDTVSDKFYEERYEFIKQFVDTNILLVESYFVNAEDKILTEYLEKFLEEGEEGAIIRQLDKPYEFKRTWQLLKFKLFEDAEFEVVGFEESKRGGMAGAIVVKLDNGSGETFKAGLKFSHEECKEMWENQSKYIGKLATIEFFGRSEYHVPRHTKCKVLGRIDI